MARTILACVLVLTPSVALADDFDDGVAAYSKRDYDLAIARFTACIRANPRSAIAHHNRGHCYSDKREYDKAIEDFSEAIRLDPKYAKAYFGRGVVYGHKLEHDKAIANYNEAIRLDPKYADAYHNRGLGYYDKREYAKAIKDYTEAIRLDPRQADSYNSRGDAYQIEGEYAKAIKDYSEAVRLDPKNPSAYNSLAWISATCPKDAMRNGKKAVEYGTKACKLTGWKEASFLDTLAAAYAEVGDFKEAVKRQKAAVELGFGDEEVLKRARKRLKLYQAGRPFRDE